MKTIGAKDLRQHMDEILDRVISGEDIIVQHRFKKPVRMSAINPPVNTDSQKLAGLQAFEAAPKQNITFDPDKSIKELYHEHLDEKYGR